MLVKNKIQIKAVSNLVRLIRIRWTLVIAYVTSNIVAKNNSTNISDKNLLVILKLVIFSVMNWRETAGAG